MNILALDCALKTGYATLINGRIESGVQDFTKRRGESNGLVFMRFNAWLNELAKMAFNDGAAPCDGHKVFDLVAYEQAHHRGGYATEIGVGLATRVQEFAARIGAECMPVHTATLKKFATGSGRAGKSAMCDAFMEIFGYKPVTDDEADAYWLLKYAMSQVGEQEARF